MSASGPKICATATDEGSHSGIAWTNPNNITANDGVFATCAMGGGDTTNPLLASNFGFAIPGGATILGIQVDVKRFASGGTVKDNGLFLQSAAVDVSADKSTASNWAGASQLDSYGGAADTWGWVGISAALINSATFGFEISGQQATGTPTAQIDYVQVTVTYSGGVAKSLMTMGAGT